MRVAERGRAYTSRELYSTDISGPGWSLIYLSQDGKGGEQGEVMVRAGGQGRIGMLAMLSNA
jgi:hypothetical protein